MQLRLLGVYGSEARSWSWNDLTTFMSFNCIVFGDFNVDLEKNKAKAEMLLSWSDSLFLCLFTPDSSTSLRSGRIIDYVFTSGFSVFIQTIKQTRTTSN